MKSEKNVKYVGLFSNTGVALCYLVYACAGVDDFYLLV